MLPAASVPAVLVLAMLTPGTRAVTGLLTEAEHGLHEPPEPAAGVTVAVLLTVPVADAANWAVMAYTTLPPTGKVARVSFSAAVPLAAGHTAPSLAVQVQLQLLTLAGRLSDTTVPWAGAWPVLVAVTV